MLNFMHRCCSLQTATCQKEVLVAHLESEKCSWKNSAGTCRMA